MNTNSKIIPFFILISSVTSLVASILLYQRKSVEELIYVILVATSLSSILSLIAVFSKKASIDEISDEVLQETESLSEAVTAELAPVIHADEQSTGDDAVLLLSLLQEKGRFVDFLMDDISAYEDAQVGAAARVIHQGCKSVIEESFSPVAVSSEPENSSISLDAFKEDEYKFLGNLTSDRPLKGTLLHKGWKPTKLNLPQRTKALEEGEIAVIAAAQVQL